MSERREKRPVMFPAVSMPIYICDRCGVEAQANVHMVARGITGLDMYADGWTAPEGWHSIRGFGACDLCPACSGHVEAALREAMEREED